MSSRRRRRRRSGRSCTSGCSDAFGAELVRRRAGCDPAPRACPRRGGRAGARRGRRGLAGRAAGPSRRCDTRDGGRFAFVVVKPRAAAGAVLRGRRLRARPAEARGDAAVLPGRGRRTRPIRCSSDARGAARDARRRAPRPTARCGSTSGCRATARRCSSSYDASTRSSCPRTLRAAVSDRAWVEAMLEAERALANAEAIVGVIPAHLAGPIAEACDVERFDVEAIVAAGRSAGNPAEPLVRALRAAVGGEAAGLRPFRRDEPGHRRHAPRCSSPAGARADRGGARRRRGRLRRARRGAPRDADGGAHAAAAGRADDVRAEGGRLARRGHDGARAAVSGARLPAQLGGAAGTLAALGPDGLAVVAAVRGRARAGRAAAAVAFRSFAASPSSARRSRSRAGVCAKIGLDVALLGQTEVGEVREPAGAGGSSTMPQKRNPVGSALAVACARRAAAASGVLVGGLVARARASGRRLARGVGRALGGARVRRRRGGRDARACSKGSRSTPAGCARTSSSTAAR